MKLSTHYYVLALSEHRNSLYEAFRGNLIDIQDPGFPFDASSNAPETDDPPLSEAQLRERLQSVDQRFAPFYAQEPLGIVLAGSAKSLTAFAAVTAYPGVIIGGAEGDFSQMSPEDLGHVVWPIVKDVMAHIGKQAERDLAAAVLEHNVAIGIDEVARAVDSGQGVTLMVEEGYRVKPEFTFFMDNGGDNVVDSVIEKVLAQGGNVIFARDEALADFNRIALILRA